MMTVMTVSSPIHRRSARRGVVDPRRNVCQPTFVAASDLFRSPFGSSSLDGPRAESRIDSPILSLIRWIEPSSHAAYQILTQPSYAGAYVYGRRRTVRRIDAEGGVRSQSQMVGRSDWKVLIRDHHEGLISWDRFERIQNQLMANSTMAGMNAPGPAREGTALLQGLAYCGQCGRRMGVAYGGDGRRFGQFVCRTQWAERGTEFFCQVIMRSMVRRRPTWVSRCGTHLAIDETGRRPRSTVRCDRGRSHMTHGTHSSASAGRRPSRGLLWPKPQTTSARPRRSSSSSARRCVAARSEPVEAVHIAHV